MLLKDDKQLPRRASRHERNLSPLPITDISATSQIGDDYFYIKIGMITKKYNLGFLKIFSLNNLDDYIYREFNVQRAGQYLRVLRYYYKRLGISDLLMLDILELLAFYNITTL